MYESVDDRRPSENKFLKMNTGYKEVTKMNICQWDCLITLCSEKFISNLDQNFSIRTIKNMRVAGTVSRDKSTNKLKEIYINYHSSMFCC